MKPFIVPHTPEWEAARCGTLTSSEMSPIFTNGTGGNMIGAGGMTYIDRKIAEILTGQMKENRQTDIMIRGQALEFEARDWYAETTNQEVVESMFFRYNEICGGTTDGGILDEDDPDEIKGIIEIKCPNSEKHIKVLAANSARDLLAIDKQYYYQPQFNMLFSGAKFADFISYDDRVINPDLRGRIIRMHPDMEWRKDFFKRINWIAGYMADQITEILKVPERNLAYRFERTPEGIENLKNVIHNIRSQA